MKKYDVTLDVLTRGLSITDFAKLLGVDQSAITCRKKGSDNMCRIVSGCRTQIPLADQVKTLLSKVRCKKPIAVTKNVKKVYLNVGVFYDSVTCSVNVSGDCLNMLIAKFPDASLELSCYPVDKFD